MAICEEMYEINETFTGVVLFLFSFKLVCEMYTYIFLYREQLSVLYINGGVNVENACPHTLENLTVFIFGASFFDQYGHLNDHCIYQKCLPMMKPKLGHLHFCNTLVSLKQQTEQILLSQQATNALTEPLLQIFMVISLVKKQDAF